MSLTVFSCSLHCILSLSCFLCLSVFVSDHLCLAMFPLASLSLPSPFPLPVLALGWVPLASFLGQPGSPPIWAGSREASPNCLPETTSVPQAALPRSSAAGANPCLNPLCQSAALGRGGGCAPSGAQGEERRGWPPEGGHSALGPAPSGPAPPGSLPAPPAVPWPQSRRCCPMNGVAFCLVGIPPRPEPRPPQVRALGQGRGADPGAAG